MGSFLARYSELRTERVDVEGGSAYVLRDIARGETLDLAEIAIDARTIEAGAAAPPRVAPDEYEELMIVKSGTLAVRVDHNKITDLALGGILRPVLLIEKRK